MVEIKGAFADTVRLPLMFSANIGNFVLDVVGRQHLANQIRQQEPRSRALTAIDVAQRALHRGTIDQDLARFEVRRAAIAVQEMRYHEVTEIGPQVVEAALELPDNDLNNEIAEHITRSMFERFARPPQPLSQQRRPGDLS